MTDLSTPRPPIGLPPMTLDQAVELANRVRTVQHGLIDLMTRNASPDSLLDHAAHAYKAAIPRLIATSDDVNSWPFVVEVPRATWDALHAIGGES